MTKSPARAAYLKEKDSQYLLTFFTVNAYTAVTVKDHIHIVTSVANSHRHFLRVFLHLQYNISLLFNQVENILSVWELHDSR